MGTEAAMSMYKYKEGLRFVADVGRVALHISTELTIVG